ncbi:F-box domain [Macleaya cordata]|uniref:F-box domain n=1 Tax=Macleaya cordata TaxID=56857 RepID=A0A200R4U7_MACCD|nr:F-box domain [Macleaya cordata]
MLMMKSDDADDIRTPSLDNDTVCKILSRLPVKSLMRFKCICKSWQSLIQSDPHFVDLQFSQSKTRPVQLISSAPPVKQGTSFFSADNLLEEGTDHGAAIHIATTSWTQPMLKPVNGLICFVDYKEGAVLIYNLSTREATPWIKTATVKKEHMRMYPSYGFGFDPTTKEHKVLCVWENLTNKRLPSCPSDQVCEVLTVGHNSWRWIHEVPPYNVHKEPFYANGALYWLSVLGSPDNTLIEVIVAFDVGSEKFRVIPIPNFILDHPPPTKTFRHSVDDLLEVDGHIALLDKTIHDENNVTFKMWIFDDDKKSSSCNWIEETISMSCDPQQEMLFSFQAIAGTNLIIVESTRILMDPVPTLYCYDRKKKTSRKVDIIATRGGIPSKTAAAPPPPPPPPIEPSVSKKLKQRIFPGRR